jgi:amino acid permease
VSWYGEAEFWFASLKIIAIIGLIILGVVLFFGGGPNHDRLGFRYWETPGAFVEPYLVPSNVNIGRFLAFWTALIKSGFSFIFSPELITTAAGEAVSPRRNIPKATNRFIYRLFAFYVLGSLVIGVTVAYNDKNLLSGVASGGSGAGASPFVIGIQNAGIKGLNHVINAAILTSTWSSGNSWVYAGSRTLYSLACAGQAPKIFTRCTKNGVPYPAVLVTWSIGLLAFLNLSSSSSDVFYWFTNITTVGGFISWFLWVLHIWYVVLSSLSDRTQLIVFTAFQQGSGFQRAHRVTTIQDSLPAVGYLLCSAGCFAASHYQRLCHFLPGLLYSIGLPVFLHCVRHFLRTLLWTQDLVLDPLDGPGGRHRCHLRQRGD